MSIVTLEFSCPLKEVKAASNSDFVIADSEGNPLSYSQFKRLWQYINVRTAMDRTYYKYINGQSIKYTVEASLGARSFNSTDRSKYPTDSSNHAGLCPNASLITGDNSLVQQALILSPAFTEDAAYWAASFFAL